MAEFHYEAPFPLSKDDTEYRLITKDYVSTSMFEGEEILKVAPEGLTLLAQEAMKDVSHLLRPAHLAKLQKILEDPEASDNDIFVARNLLQNAVISAEGIFPSCQDTGTAIVMGKKGQKVWTGANDEEALSKGVFKTYTETNLRYSQNVPLTMYEEKNTGTNLPAQIDLYSTEGGEYKFLFMAKGGGSANKTYLYQQTKALLNQDSLKVFMAEKLKTLGTAACPPYHVAFVVGGTSAESTLKNVKLASAGYLDNLPTSGSEGGRAFRDIELEEEVLEMAQKSGIGAQYGGKYFAHDIRIVRLPRHGASCPVGMGVSCSADRNIKAKINKDGIWLEKLEVNPGKFLVEAKGSRSKAEPTRIDLNKGMENVRAQLSKLQVKDMVLLNGDIIVARDIAHARLAERLKNGEGLPQYLKDHPVYYAGPAKTPEGFASGSMGPTTSQRMDPYVHPFQEAGGSMVMVAKGNRSQQVIDSCKKHGGFYLGSIGGAAAVLAKENIVKQELIEYPELGMEAVYKITVEDFPCFIITDDKGNDFFDGLL